MQSSQATPSNNGRKIAILVEQCSRTDSNTPHNLCIETTKASTNDLMSNNLDRSEPVDLLPIISFDHHPSNANSAIDQATTFASKDTEQSNIAAALSAAINKLNKPSHIPPHKPVQHHRSNV
jgi:hypothetical protein